MAETPPSPQNSLGIWRRSIAAILSLIVLFGSVGLYLIKYGFTFPPCGAREYPLELPDFLQTPATYIIFERPMMYIVPPNGGPEYPRSRVNCTELQIASRGFLLPLDLSTNKSKGTPSFLEEDGFRALLLPKGTQFTFEKRAYIKCFGFCLGGSARDTFLIRDDQGDLWQAEAMHFNYFNEEEKKETWAAGYYRNGVRLGDVVFDEFDLFDFSR
jgi:hypothetical protein